MGKKGKEKDTPVELCYGITLSPAFFERKENRALTLMVKGFIVYLLSMGSIGFYLSAVNAQYNILLCHFVIGAMAFLCSFLYYRLLTENLGYLLIFVVFGILVYYFRIYINSGFYALVNMTVDLASQYLNVDIQRLYTEQIEDRYVTVTFTSLFIGIVLDILLNVYISRRMQYVNALLVVMGLNLIPLYLTEEPDMLYAAMVIGGISMAYVLKSGKHYSPQMNVKRDDFVFTRKGRRKSKRKSISYVYDVKVMLQAGLRAALVAFCIILVVSVVRPKERFNVGYGGNKYKELTMAGVTTLLVDGLSGFFDQRESRGGVYGGELGNVSSIRLDHETDLVVKFTPYTYDRIYLKGFEAVDYIPYSNRWTNSGDVAGYTYTEADALEAAYDNQDVGTARGIMEIIMVGVNPSTTYIPYYSNSWEKEELKETVIFYPREDQNATIITEAGYQDAPYTAGDLYVPEENRDAIEKLCKNIDPALTQEEKIDALKDYYQNNIPYTIRPGRTPKNQDFVNYFLNDNQKGYCVHFATAAVLAFRYMGIPARYVEGYAIDYNQIEDGTLLEGDYRDYYSGYSELGKTAPVQVNVTDADAHAWVEVYIAGKGWIPVEVTPAGEAEEVEDFWDMFNDVMENDKDSQTDNAAGNLVNFRVSGKVIRFIAYFLIAAACLSAGIVITVYAIGQIVKYIRYRKAGISDRLIIIYSAYCKKKRKRDDEFANKMNYSAQIQYLAGLNGKKDDCDRVTDILERAGFSDKEISTDEYNLVKSWLR